MTRGPRRSPHREFPRRGPRPWPRRRVLAVVRPPGSGARPVTGRLKRTSTRRSLPGTGTNPPGQDGDIVGVLAPEDPELRFAGRPRPIVAIEWSGSRFRRTAIASRGLDVLELEDESSQTTTVGRLPDELVSGRPMFPPPRRASGSGEHRPPAARRRRLPVRARDRRRTGWEAVGSRARSRAMTGIVSLACGRTSDASAGMPGLFTTSRRRRGPPGRRRSRAGDRRP